HVRDARCEGRPHFGPLLPAVENHRPERALGEGGGFLGGPYRSRHAGEGAGSAHGFGAGAGRIAQAEKERLHHTAPSHSARTLSPPSAASLSSRIVAARAGSSRRSAQIAAPRTSGEGSPSRATTAGTSACWPELPMPISTLRRNRAWPIRLT